LVVGDSSPRKRAEARTTNGLPAGCWQVVGEVHALVGW